MSAEPHAWNPLDYDRPALTCIVLQRCDAAHVHPIGVLDIATVPVLERQLQEVRAAGFRRLIVDLGGLSFMDSTGLRLALKWHAAARQDGFEISFVRGKPAVQRVFEITGTSGRLRFIHPESDPPGPCHAQRCRLSFVARVPGSRAGADGLLDIEPGALISRDAGTTGLPGPAARG